MKESLAAQKPKLKTSEVTDFHYSQVYFVVGHMAVKMLVYFDEQEEMIKRVIGGTKKSALAGQSEAQQ